MKFSPFGKDKASVEADLDITPFLSLMVVLIPVLLVSVKFSLLAQYDVHSEPQQNVVAVQNSKPSVAPYRLKITRNDFKLTQGRHLLLDAGLDDRKALVEDIENVIAGLKSKAPLYIQLEATHSYQSMVSLLDILHQHEAVFSSVSIDVKENV
ncbi:MAG: biopolymer transporter ExbD [Vibrio fluvialis]